MKPIFPLKLKQGNTIMIVAPSDSLGCISKEVKDIADERFAEMGLKISFAKNVNRLNEFDSSSIESRIADLHEAFFRQKCQRNIFCIWRFQFESTSALHRLEYICQIVTSTLEQLNNTCHTGHLHFEICLRQVTRSLL